MATSESSADRRLTMVNCQLRTGDVTDQSVLSAFLDVPREAFVAPAMRLLAYLDRPVAAAAGARRLMAPLALARLLQAARVAPGDRALDVGGGSGYGAALLAAMGAKTVALESDAAAAAAARAALAGRPGVAVVEGPLEAGAAAHGPFDVIVVEGAFETFPHTLIAELAEGGRLVGVDASAGAPQAAIYERRGEAVSRRALFECRADALDGLRRAPSFAF